MLVIFWFCLFQFALGKPQAQIPVGFTEQQQEVPPVIPIEIWSKYESHIPAEYYEIGKHDAALRSSFWQAALRHEAGPYFELGQILVPGTFEGPNGIKGSFGSASSVLNSERVSSTGMSWSSLIQPGQDALEEEMSSDKHSTEERAQNAFINQNEGVEGNQVANINQHGSSNRGGQTAEINQSGSSHGQTATINQGSPNTGHHGYLTGGSSSQAAGINQAAQLGVQAGSQGSGYSQNAASQSQQLGVGQSQGHLGAGVVYNQRPSYSQLTGLNTAQLSSSQQSGLHATGQIQQTGIVGVRPGYSQLTGLNQAAGINQYQFQKPGYLPTAQASALASASASSSSSSSSHSSSYNNTQSSILSNLGQLQSAGINTHQGTNIHSGFNTASGTNTGPNNYNGPNSGSVANLHGRPQDTVSIVGPSSPLTGSSGSIHVNG